MTAPILSRTLFRPHRPTALVVFCAMFVVGLARPAAAQGYPFWFERLAQEQGLSNGTVTAVTQDSHGFLWVGTQDGLDLYDGTGFTIYRPAPGDTASLLDAWITALAPSHGGEVWIGMLHGGIARFEPQRAGFRRYQHVNGDTSSLANNDVQALLEANDGTLWAGTSSGLERVDTATGRSHEYRPTNGVDSARFNNDIISLLEQPDGPLWVGTRRGVYLFDRARGRFEELSIALQTREIHALALDRSGLVWIGTQDDLVAVDPHSHRVVRRYTRDTSTATNASGGGGPAGNGVNALELGPDGTLWMGTNDGVVAFDPFTGTYVRHTRDLNDPRSLGGPIVHAVYVDRGGVLWVGTESYGLSKHAPAAVAFDLIRHDPSAAQSLSDGYIRGIAGDSRGNVWIATQNGGLDRLDPRSGKITAFEHREGDPHSLPNNNVWQFLEDHTGTVWVGLHEAGMGRFDPATGRFTRAPFVPDNSSVNVLYEDREGTLWIGLENLGLYEVSPDRQHVRSYGQSVGDERILVHNDVEAILEARDGALWVGGSGGLTRLDRATGRATQFHGVPGQPDSLSNSFVTDIFQDSKGTIWVATKGGGIDRYDSRTGTFRSYGTAQGLPHDFIYGILEDAHGKLWLSSDDGLAMFDPAAGLVTHYDLEDGLQAREFNRRAFYRSSDGTMYFGGISGVNIFHPDVLDAMPPPPAVSFVALTTDGKRRTAVQFTADSVVRLSPERNSFTISFAALDFTAPSKIKYKYKLDGVDRDWVLSDDRHQATYASVPPGRHLFRAIAASPDGAWNLSGAAVTFEVVPPWWETWWARALGVLVLAGIVLGVMRLRLRAAARRSAELERRVEEQTHDLTAAQHQLRESLDREREAARELFDLTAAVPGAVFQLREDARGARTFSFVSEGIMRLLPEAPGLYRDAHRDPRRAAELLLTHIVPEDVPAFEQSLAASRRTAENWRVDVRCAPAGGEPVRWVAIEARAARQTDGSLTWTGVITDATAARHAEAERVALESKMLQAQKAESLAVLAGGVAHDFNNVLLSVVVGAELLEYQVGENERATETVKRIRTAGYRAAELTQQMLAYAGKGRITVERVDLGRLVSEMLSLVRATVPRTIEIDFTTGDVPPIVEADATQLRQIVMNLVTNASEAIGERTGHITVRVAVEQGAVRDLSLRHAAADMPADGPYVVLDVADDGCGMEPALLDRIFDPFFSTKFTGRGLGLAALLGIVRGHHGGVNVISEPGRGTRFLLYFPLAEGAARTPPNPATAQPEPAAGITRVLVADDEQDVREIAKAVLERLGYAVVLANDGAEAVAAAERHAVDVFLLDVTMPKMNGAAAARALRERGITAPIVLMSGYAEEDLLTRGLTIDADAFLKKPFLASELSTVLKDVLRARTVA